MRSDAFSFCMSIVLPLSHISVNSTYIIMTHTCFPSCRSLERAQSVLFENSSILEFGVKLDGSTEGIARTGSGGHGEHSHGKWCNLCGVICLIQFSSNSSAMRRSYYVFIVLGVQLNDKLFLYFCTNYRFHPLNVAPDSG